MARDPVRRREGEVGASRGAAEGAGAVGKRTRVEAVYPTLARALRGEADPAAGDEAPTIHDAATAAVEHKGGGAPVDGGVAATVGAHVGADFGGVRVHQDALATEASAAMGARAFAHGADVFLGAGESGGDLGLMAHELTHVAQQGAAGRRAVQRKVEVGDANSPAEHEADAVAAAVTGGASPAALLVDDGPVAPGQMLKSTFLAELRAEVTAAADAELGPMFSAIGCPYIDQYFRRYTGRSAADGEALLRRYAPGVRSARDARAMIPIVVERVRAGVAVWRDTGQPPPEVAALEPAAAAAATAAGAPAAGAAAGPPGSAAATVARMGPAEALPGAVASQMSSVLGHDVSGVQIHIAPQAAAFASDHGASAVTVGSHVAFAAGQFSPGTAAGDALLAHELAHTVQQAGATATDLQQPLGAERSADEDEADDVAATVAVAHATGAAPKRSLGGFLRGGVSLQRCNVATKAPADFAAMGVKDKASWIESTLRSGKDGRGYAIVEALRQVSPSDFVALQSQTDFAAVVASLSDWDAVNVGAMGPVVGPAAPLLNAKRAAYVAHALAEYGGAQAEVHAAYVVSTMYDDDLDDLAFELANRNKLGRLLRMPTVRAQIDRRGVSMDRYQDAGDSRGGLRKFAGGMAERLWDMVSSNHDDDHYAHALPGEFGAASQAIDIEGTLPVSPGGLAHMLDNTLTFGMVGGVVGLGTNTVHGIGALIEGDYEAAGADMTDAAVALLVHLGVKMLQKAGSAKSSQPGSRNPRPQAAWSARRVPRSSPCPASRGPYPPPRPSWRHRRRRPGRRGPGRARPLDQPHRPRRRRARRRLPAQPRGRRLRR
ncbi:MAG: DUF4157 domain-containing protein [bacterium]